MLTQDELAKQIGYLTLQLWTLAKERDEALAKVREKGE